MPGPPIAPRTLPLALLRVGASDASQYASVARETFREAYGSTSDATNMETHLAREFGEALQRAELEDPAVSVLAAREESGDWAGFVALRRGHRVDGPRAAHPIEIARFYVRGRWHGRGAAQFLMRSVLEVADAAGHDGVWLQVWEHNARARRFYEKCGFVAVGTNPFRFGDVWENDIVYEHAIPRPHRAGG